MIDEIIAAMQQECKALVAALDDDVIGQYVLRTDYKDTGDITYTFPLLVMYMADAQQSESFCGGATSMQWNFSLAVYAYDPNVYGDDDSGYSESLTKPIDTVRRHFSPPNRMWLTQVLKDVQQKYSFSLTFDGNHKAPPLKYGDGLALGYALLFGSVSIDNETDSVEYSTTTLNEVVQVNYPPTT